MERARKILITSSKGGIGKSTAALGIATALAARGHRTLLVDADAGNRCLDLMLGMQDSVLYDLADVCAARCAPQNAVLSVPAQENLFFTAAPSRIPVVGWQSALPGALADLQKAAEAEYVICDTAGLGAHVEEIARSFADGILVVTTQQPAAVRAAERTSARMQELADVPCRMLISVFEVIAAEEGERAGLLAMIDGAHTRILGVIPKDRTLLLAQEKGELPSAKSRAGMAFSNIAGRLLGENIRLFAGIRKIRTRRVL